MVIARTLLAFGYTPCVDEIVLVCREEDLVEIHEIIRYLESISRGWLW